MFHPSIPLYYPYLPWLNLKKELRRARLSAALTMPWSLRCQADCIWLSPKIKVGTYWNKWSKWVNLENFPHSVKFMSIHVKFTLLHHTAHQISSDSFSACRFYQLIPEPAEPLTFSKAGEHQAAAWSRVPCAHSYPALPESQNVGLVNFGSRTSGQDGPRCAEMGQDGPELRFNLWVYPQLIRKDSYWFIVSANSNLLKFCNIVLSLSPYLSLCGWKMLRASK